MATERITVGLNGLNGLGTTLREWGYRRTLCMGLLAILIVSSIFKNRYKIVSENRLDDLIDHSKKKSEIEYPFDYDGLEYSRVMNYYAYGISPLPYEYFLLASNDDIETFNSKNFFRYEWFIHNWSPLIYKKHFKNSNYPPFESHVAFKCLHTLVDSHNTLLASGSESLSIYKTKTYNGPFYSISGNSITTKYTVEPWLYTKISSIYHLILNFFNVEHTVNIDESLKEFQNILLKYVNSYTTSNDTNTTDAPDSHLFINNIFDPKESALFIHLFNSPPLLRRAFAFNCIEALNDLSSSYLYANIKFLGLFGQKKNFKEAYEIYLKAANVKGEPFAHRMVGIMLALGLGVEHDYKLAHVHMNIASFSGDIIATHILAYWNYAGIATEKNIYAALHHYTTVADMSIKYYLSKNPFLGIRLPFHPQYAYDDSYYLFGTHPNNPKPFDLTEMSNFNGRILENRDLWQAYYLRARNGDPIANLIMGFIHYNGKSSNRDRYKQAIKHFNLVLDYYLIHNNNPQQISESVTYEKSRFAARNALGMIGKMYWAGEGVRKNERIAMSYFEKGAAFGDGQSLNYLGIMHKNGIAGLKPNIDKALEFFEKAAGLKSIDAIFNIALTNFENEHYSFAYNGFKTAYNNGHLMSAYYMAIMEERGLGTKKDIHSATRLLKWISENANWHDPSLRFASMLEKDDPELSFIYYLIAAESGYELAQVNAAVKIDSNKIKISKSNTLSSYIKNPEELAFKLFYRSSVQGNPYALYKLANYFYYNTGTQNYKFDIPSMKLHYKLEKKQQIPPPTAVPSDVANDAGNDATNYTTNDAVNDTANYTTNDTLLNMITSLLNTLLTSLHIKPAKFPSSPPNNDSSNFRVAALIYNESFKSCGSPISVWSLGWMYENGVGVIKNYEKAMHLYKTTFDINPDLHMASALSIAKLYVRIFIEEKISSLKKFISKRMPIDKVKDVSNEGTNEGNGTGNEGNQGSGNQGNQGSGTVLDKSNTTNPDNSSSDNLVYEINFVRDGTYIQTSLSPSSPNKKSNNNSLPLISSNDIETSLGFDKIKIGVINKNSLNNNTIVPNNHSQTSDIFPENHNQSTSSLIFSPNNTDDQTSDPENDQRQKLLDSIEAKLRTIKSITRTTTN